MPGFVKTAKDEQIWTKAKDIASQKFGNAKSDSFYAYANTVFHRMKGMDESTPGYITNEEADNHWSKISEYILKHPVYSELPDDEKYGMVHEAHSKYGEHKKEGGTKELLEFVSTFGGNGGFGGMAGGLAINGGIGFGGTGTVGGLGGYSMGGLGGGARSEAPKGPYVFGSPGTDQGTPPAFKTNGEPAVVIVPDKESNYKPWEKTLDAFGNDTDDIKRNQTVSAQDDEFDGPVGDVVSALEDMGIDVEQLQHMTQEEMEDLITKAFKREQALNQHAQAQQQVSQTKDVRTKIQEAFSFEEFTEKLDREGRIQKGRNFLADKLQQKQAIEKDSDNRRYKLDQYDIERMLSQKGFVYNYERKEWLKKDPKERAADDAATTAVVAPPKVAADGSPIPQPVVTPVAVVPPVEPKPVAPVPPAEPENLDKLNDPEIKHKIKVLQARFILAMGHGDNSSTEFVEDEKTKERKPVVEDKDIVSKIEMIKYSWNADKMLWLDVNMTLPHVFFDNKESQKTLIARSFLAALGAVEKIHVGNNGHASTRVETLVTDMEAKHYEWNAEAHRWKFVEPVKESLNEADDHSDDNTDDSEEPQENVKAKIPYNPVASLMAQGRYLLRAHQISQITKAGDTEKEEPLKEFKEGDPTVFKKGKQVQDSVVKQKLHNGGFTVHGTTWVDSNNGNRFPGCVEKLGDNEKSFIARGNLAALKNDDQWIAIIVNGLESKNTKAEGSISPDHVIGEMNALELKWDEGKKTWVKLVPDKSNTMKTNGVKNAKDSEAELGHAIGLTPEKQEFIDRFRSANWDYMSAADREKYKEISAEKGAIKELGLDEKNWPNLSNFARKRYIRKFSQNYKFTVDPKTGSKSWIRRDKPVTRSFDMVGLKAAIGGVARGLQSSYKGGAWVGGALGKVLSAAGKIQA